MTVVPFRPRPQTTRQAQAVSAQSSRIVKPPAGIKAIGIDLGTTNSVVSVFRDHLEQPETLAYGSNANLVPSVIHWDPELSHESVGKKAFEQSNGDLSAIIRSTKRLMGHPEHFFSSNGRSYSPEQSATSILRYLAQHPVLQNELEVNKGLWAVVTVPAHFDDAARLATIAAAESAKINVLRIVNEPTAAALAYSMLPDVRHVEQETLVVYDLGGGTFDVSVVERDGLVFNVLASEGDVQLGGDDLDHALAEHLISQVQPPFAARRIKSGTPAYKELLQLAEDAKKSFQTVGQVQIKNESLDEMGAHIDITLQRDVFEKLAAPFIEKTLILTERAIHAARKKAKNISRILQVGGSTRVGLVRKMLEQYFPNCLVDARLEPDLAVSWGASLQAAIILGLDPSTILVDVCSHSLGVGVAEDSRSIDENFKKVSKKFGILTAISEEQLQNLLGDRVSEFHRELRGLLRVAPIVHRNSAIPSKRSEFFNTLYDNQSAVQVIVVQGEGETVSENRLIGTFMFQLKQPCPAGSKCEIQLTYDQNGMVHVLAKQLETNNQAEAVFDSRTGEVSGWIAISDQEFDTAQQATGVSSNSFPTDVAPELPHDQPKSSSSLQQNAFLVKARRQLMRKKFGSAESLQLNQMIAQYEELLARSASGDDCDDDLDTLEQSLERYLES